MDEKPPGKPLPVRGLSFHADYRCRNTGICCSSGWEIAVEEPVELSLRPRLQAKHGTPNGPDGFVPMPDPPKGCKSAFRQTPAGVCWFRDPDRRDCAIHREFGEDALASACRQFPRVVVLEPSQVSVSLSHYCPTAASLLFRASSDFSLRDSPEAFPAGWPFEGLEAREAYSPLLRPGVLLGFEGLRRLEDEAIALLSEPGFGTGIVRLEASFRRILKWSPVSGPVPDFVTSSFRESCQLPVSPFAPGDPRPILRRSIPNAVTPPALPNFIPGPSPVSPRIDLALRRYLAARLVGGWIVFQADCLSATARYLRLCLDTVHLFASGCERAEAEPERWREAIRSADLWLLHLCDPESLARELM